MLRCRVKKQFFKPLIKRLEFKYRPSLSFSDGMSLLGYIFKPTTWSSKLFPAFCLKDRVRHLSLGLRALASARYTPILLQHLFKHSSTRSPNLSAAMPCCPASQPTCQPACQPVSQPGSHCLSAGDRKCHYFVIPSRFGPIPSEWSFARIQIFFQLLSLLPVYK